MLYVRVHISDTARPYIHLLPVLPGELPASWLHRIADRSQLGFRTFSELYLNEKVRNSAGFDAYPNVKLLKALGAIAAHSETEFVRDHTLLGTTQCFYNQADWRNFLATMEESESRGQNRSRSSPRKHWHICPKCREIESASGTLTWQRDAQLPGIRYCARCAVPLALVTKTKIRSSSPPSANDLATAITKPVLSSHREQQHVQLARDLSEAFSSGLPNLGTDGLTTAIFRMTETAGLFSPYVNKKLPWEKMLRQVTDTFGEDIFIETELLVALRRVKQGAFFKFPAPDSMVLLALLTRAFGQPLIGLFNQQSMHPTVQEP